MAIASDETVQPVGGPPLPLGRRVELPGRGTTFIREVHGPPGAPTVLLLHGWLASAGLNWFQAFDDLAGRYHVVAPDLRGHGRGIRTRKRFTLADCADDVGALLDELGTGPVIAVGYSLGGPVAQLLWKRHRRHVDGLVLCATSHYLMPGMREQYVFGTFMLAAVGSTRLGMLAAQVPIKWMRDVLPVNPAQRPATFRKWAQAEMGRHHYIHLMEAGLAMSNYHARWVEDIDVPTAVVVTTRDRAVNPLAQARMAFKIPGASIHRIDDGHITCARPGFGRPIAAAVDDVAARAYPGRG